jgi:triphosphoribosyl-dephospho-CoA synthase
MAAAAGQTFSQKKVFSVSRFRENLRFVCKSTTSADAVNVYDAIALARPGGLGKAPEFDVTDPTSKEKIQKKGTSLYDVFKISSSWDSISAEWVNNYHITFDVGYPFLKLHLDREKDANTAVVHTFLKILSEIPDTLIIRKAGLEKAKWASSLATQILEAEGLTTKNGKSKLLQLDRKLHDPGHKLNPGTTADLTSACTALAVLNGYRP